MAMAGGYLIESALNYYLIEEKGTMGVNGYRLGIVGRTEGASSYK